MIKTTGRIEGATNYKQSHALLQLPARNELRHQKRAEKSIFPCTAKQI
jgi:hypothetical protein